MRRFTVIFLCFLSVNFAKSQAWSPKDSIILSLQSSPSLIVGFDKRDSYVVGVPVNIFGLRIGYDYGKIALLGSYYSALATKESNTYDYTILGAIFEYHWYKTHRIRLYQTIQTGIGTVDIKEIDLITKNSVLKTNMIIPIETGVTANFRFLKYFGLTLGVGARTSITPDTYYTAPYYSYGIMLFTKDLIKDIKKYSK